MMQTLLSRLGACLLAFAAGHSEGAQENPSDDPAGFMRELRSTTVVVELDRETVSFGRFPPGETRRVEIEMKGHPESRPLQIHSVKVLELTEPGPGLADVTLTAEADEQREESLRSIKLEVTSKGRPGYFGGRIRLEMRSYQDGVREIPFSGWVAAPEESPEAAWDPEALKDDELEDPAVQIAPVPYFEALAPDDFAQAEALIPYLRHGTGDESERAVRELTEIGDAAVPVLINAFIGLDMSDRDDRLIGQTIDSTLYRILQQGNARWFVDPLEKSKLRGGIETYDQRAVNLWVELYCLHARDRDFWWQAAERRRRNTGYSGK